MKNAKRNKLFQGTRYPKKYKASSIFKSKKGINDVSIFTIITLILMTTGLLVPFVNSEFNTDRDLNAVGDDLIQSDVAENIGITGAVSIGDIIKSISKMFFWTFGDLPVWLDLLFIVLRLQLLFIIVRNFTPTLGGA